MSEWTQELRRRLAVFNLPPAKEAGIIDELSLHLDERVAELVREGRTRAEARQLALDDLSEAELRQGGWRKLPVPPPPDPPPGAAVPRVLDGLRQDLRYAVRSLKRQPGFVLAATLALALGIGATSAIFAAVDAVLLRPMPFPHADRLFVPVSEHAGRGIEMGSVSFADYEDWRRETDLFAEVALWQPRAVDMSGEGDPERLASVYVSDGFFSLADVRPLVGRAFVAGDYASGSPNIVLITDGLWQRRFGGARDVVGRTIRLAGVPHEIVGVVPARQVWPDDTAAFLPMQTTAFNDDIRTRRDNMIFLGLARLREGVSPDAARAQVAAIAERVAQEHPESRAGWTNTLVPLREYIVSAEVRLALYVLLGAVAAVLLIACANVANLALVRGTGRSRELAVRLSLGASRRRLLQQLLVESAVLSAAGVAMGLGVALLVMKGLVLIAPDGTPFLNDIGLDARVLLATVVTGLVATLISGLMPALSTSALRLAGAFSEGAARSGSSRRVTRLRNVLVVVEIAAAVVLVTSAALLIRSFDRLSRVDPGVSLDRVLSARVSIPASRYPTGEDTARFVADVVTRLEASPEIERAAATSFVPVGGGGFGLGRVFLAEGRPEPPAGEDVDGQWNVITPHYFETVGIPVLEGRAFTDRDDAGSVPVIVVSHSFARKMFGSESPIGRRVRSWRDENVLREIVGVVGEVKYFGLSDDERPLVYVPHAQNSWGLMLLVARSRTTQPAALAGTLRRVVGSVDPEIALADVRTLAASSSESIASQRYATLLLAVLAGVALTLSALGIYGVTSYVFTLRRREMGIRLALGASRRSLYGLVFRHGFGLTVLGLAIGLAGSAGASRVLRGLLFNTETTDATAWTAMTAVVLLSTAVACFVPARRAAGSDPTWALRAE
jgi:putative ABC transport system permease protein